MRAQSGVGPSDAADEEHLQSEGGPANTIHDLLHGLRGVAALWPWLSLIVFSIVLTNVGVFGRRHHDVFMRVAVISGLKTLSVGCPGTHAAWARDQAASRGIKQRLGERNAVA